MVGRMRCRAGPIIRRMMQMTISIVSCCNPTASEYWQPRGGICQWYQRRHCFDVSVTAENASRR